MAQFRTIDRHTPYLLPPCIDDWVSEDHLARFIVEALDQLDLSGLTKRYGTGGVAPYHPVVLLGVLIYGYATGTFSSRKLEKATHESVVFRFVAANQHPDHDTLAHFRARFLNEIEELFVQVLKIAVEMKLTQLGKVCLDGTKIHANASRHSALSYGHIEKLEAQLKAEVQELLELAEKTDQAEAQTLSAAVNLPEELKRREVRLAAMAEAKKKIEARAKERFERENAEYQAKLAARLEKEKATGKKASGKAPTPPQEGPRESDQINLTDEQSRIMPVSGGGFEQAYNAQAAVDVGSMLIIAPGLTQAPNDKQQITPMLETLANQAPTQGQITHLIADTGFCSEDNMLACEQSNIVPLLALARENHHPGWRERHTEPVPLTGTPTPTEMMAHRLKTSEGRKLYALRKQTVEPVFGIIKSVMGFRQFSMRGLAKARGEWTLVCMAWNLKRMAVLRQKFI